MCVCVCVCVDRKRERILSGPVGLLTARKMSRRCVCLDVSAVGRKWIEGWW